LALQVPWIFADKSVKTAVRHGLVFDIGAGMSMGYGSIP
jgi:hypothetical protein